MKAIPIKIDGIQFRSKLEGRWYLFMKKLGWNIIYEPEIEGLNNWIPDFLIIGKDRKTLVDVKPIDTKEDWEKHPDRIRIEESGIKNLTQYELLILGTNLQLDGHNHMGILYVREPRYNEEKKKYEGFEELNASSDPTFSKVDGKYGFMDHQGNWHCRITGEGGKTYIFRDSYGPGKYSDYQFIDHMWNEAGTQLQWNTPTSEYYMKGKTHPNSGQSCLDCKTKSVNWWKKKNLFYCTKCTEVKPLYCYAEENLDDEEKRFANKEYSSHSRWSRGKEKITFYFATTNSPKWIND